MSSLHLPVVLERTLLVALLGLLVWAPLPVGSNRDWAIGVLVVWVGVAGILWALGQLSGLRFALGEEHSQSGRISRFGWALAGLLWMAQVWVAVQWLFGLSSDEGATFQYLMLGFAYSGLFVLVLEVFRTRARLTLLLSVLVVSGTAQAFYGAFMTLSGIEWLVAGPKLSYLGDATGTFVNRNHLAGYLEMTLGCGVGLLLALRDGLPLRWVNVLETLLGPKARLRLALVVMVIALVMTHSRGGNTGFFIGLLVAGVVFVLRSREHRLRNGLILASIVLIDVLVISQYFGLERLKERVLGTQLSDVVVDGEVVKRANELRDDVFVQALPLVEDRPLTGHGAGAFEAVFPRFAGDDIRLHFDHAHNDYLQFVIEFGLVGMLPLALFVLLALWKALRALWRAESAYRSGVAFGAMMAIVAILVHSGTDFNLQIPANAATFVVICAVAVLASDHKHRRRVRQGAERSVLGRFT